MISAELQSSLNQVRARHDRVEIAVSLGADGAVLAMIRVPPSLRRQGRANAALSDLVAWADEYGQTLALTPTPVGRGASKTALQRWYAGHGFVSNKGRTGNLSFRETMIREPRERRRDTGLAADGPGFGL